MMLGMKTTAHAPNPQVQSARVERDRLARLSTEELRRHQLSRLNRQLNAILPTNHFYSEKLGTQNLQLDSLDDLNELPYTFKSDLAPEGRRKNQPKNLTWSADDYVRFHRTSGTLGRPMVVFDTNDDWQWWISTWQYVLDAAEIGPSDRCILAFSFGPFIGFWSAFDAIAAREAMVIPTGGMSSLGRLDVIQSTHATAMFCTPSYALHLAEVAAENGIVTRDCGIRTIVVAGEPGGSIPSTRSRIEKSWNARVIDHGGASEIGPWGVGDRHGKGLHVIESEFIAEFISVRTGGPAEDGELSELVLTTLGRTGSPVIRYRTGDLVRPRWNTNVDECNFVLLEGGAIGRSDDMLVIRGVNVFPSSIEQILRGFPEIVEFRMTASRKSEMDQLKIEIEDRLSKPERVQKELHVRLGLRIDVECVAVGTLPRSEGKSKRFVDQR
jgi:phenylacetate-CoA ligase